MDGNYKGLIMLVYHSPNSSDVEFVDFLEEACINNIHRDSVIIMGDFNIDMKRNNHIQGKLTKVMNSVGLKQLVHESTRIVCTSETIIDLVFSNIEMEVAVCHEPKITDYSTVVLYWNIIRSENKNNIIIRRDYKRLDVDEFKKIINVYFNAIERESINILANLAIKAIIKCLDMVAPPKIITLKNKWQGKQWYTEYIYHSIKQRDNGYKTVRISKSKADWELFRRLRNKTVDTCRKAKRGYLVEKLDRNKRNAKQMWGTLKEMLKGSLRNNNYNELQK